MKSKLILVAFLGLATFSCTSRKVAIDKQKTTSEQNEVKETTFAEQSHEHISQVSQDTEKTGLWEYEEVIIKRGSDTLEIRKTNRRKESSRSGTEVKLTEKSQAKNTDTREEAKSSVSEQKKQKEIETTGLPWWIYLCLFLGVLYLLTRLKI